jgi:hypothetical protein
MAQIYASGKNVEEGEWHFLGTLEFNDGIFQELELEPFSN